MNAKTHAKDSYEDNNMRMYKGGSQKEKYRKIKYRKINSNLKNGNIK